jgi:hypothetical protein
VCFNEVLMERDRGREWQAVTVDLSLWYAGTADCLMVSPGFVRGNTRRSPRLLSNLVLCFQSEITQLSPGALRPVH